MGSAGKWKEEDGKGKLEGNVLITVQFLSLFVESSEF